MLWTTAIILLSGFGQVWSENKLNGTEPDIAGSVDPSSVCKADYNSKFNIDSKELGTTCVSKSRVISKLLLSNKLKQAIEKMKQDFQQLQDLIDQETVAADDSSIGGANKDPWRGESLTVHRDYQKEHKNFDKVARFSDRHHEIGASQDMSRGSNNNQVLPTMTNSQSGYFGVSGPSIFQPKVNQFNDNYGEKDFTRDDQAQRFDYDPRRAYQHRVLADIRLDPEENYHSSFQNQRSGKNVKVPADIALNPPAMNF